jgi:hypothetical protein
MAADETYLLGLVADINARPDFPLADDERMCRFCAYRSLNDRGVEAGSLSEWDEDYDEPDLSDFNLDVDQIGEIEF